MLRSWDRVNLFLLVCLEVSASGTQDFERSALPRLLRSQGEQDHDFSLQLLKTNQETKEVKSHRAMEIDVGGAMYHSSNGNLGETMFNIGQSDSTAHESKGPTRVYMKKTFVDVEDGHASHASATQIKYERFAGSYNLCMTVANTDSVINSTLVLEECSDGDKKFLFEPPLPNKSGTIRWAKDSTKCLYNHNGWLGNGNEIVMHDCDDADSTVEMTFYHARLNGSSSFWWTYNTSVVPTRILEIDQHNRQFPDPAVPDTVVLWDSSCEATWLVE
jgi:hypothetical protein